MNSNDKQIYDTKIVEYKRVRRVHDYIISKESIEWEGIKSKIV